MTDSLLLTGFEPFGGSPINPSEQVARALDGETIGALRITSRILPVERQRGPQTLLAALRQAQPAAVICLGEASGNAAIAIERVAINLLDFRIPDNAGEQVSDAPIVADGPAAYFSTFPARAMLAAIQAAGAPAVLSLSAGAFLCNQALYTLLHHLATERLRIPAGFIHLPSLPEQSAANARPAPSMSVETSLRAVRAAIAALESTLADEASPE